VKFLEKKMILIFVRRALIKRIEKDLLTTMSQKENMKVLVC
jgi:hypothetical protein